MATDFKVEGEKILAPNLIFTFLTLKVLKSKRVTSCPERNVCVCVFVCVCVCVWYLLLCWGVSG